MARICEQKGDQPGALAAWRRAVNADPENVGLRDRFAAWLEGEELYDEDLPHLKWLKEQNAGGRIIGERIDLAARASLLRKEILGGASR